MIPVVLSADSWNELPLIVTNPLNAVLVSQVNVRFCDLLTLSMELSLVQFSAGGMFVVAPLIGPTSAPPGFVKVNWPPAAGMNNLTGEPVALDPLRLYD